MKTLVYAAPEKVEVREMPVPEPKEGQVRIRVPRVPATRA